MGQQVFRTSPGRVALLAVALLVSACASVPFDYPREPSTYLPAENTTPVGEVALQWQARHGGKSGFLGMPDGVDALPFHPSPLPNILPLLSFLSFLFSSLPVSSLSSLYSPLPPFPP